jgi:hypothetical protein
MKSIRAFAFVFAIALGALANIASAQSARGSFTLSHEVHWQNSVVPAGSYQFSLEPRGPSALLMLRSASSTPAAYMILVSGIGSPKSSDSNRLVMVSRAGKSFVRAMDLPDFDTTLHFTVPESTEKELVLASDTPVPTHLR